MISSMAKDILFEVMRFRRMTSKPHVSCSTSCEICASQHLNKIINFIEVGKPISFVLPAFPGKSPNLAKVLGKLPDMAERYSLQFLDNLCESITKFYSPGANIIICSDGRVFSDIVGMKDSDITEYQQQLENIIHQLNLRHISTFNLDKHHREIDFSRMRQSLIDEFAEPIEALREKVKRGSSMQSSREEREAHRMYLGITRFLFEDSLYPGQIKSKTEIQKDARKRAYGVIQRSNAWSKLISEKFPDHVRLSIHPQTCGDVKLGIKLLSDNWMTPWHGVALNKGHEVIIVKRFEAEQMGAQLIYDDNGIPDHFVL